VEPPNTRQKLLAELEELRQRLVDLGRGAPDDPLFARDRLAGFRTGQGKVLELLATGKSLGSVLEALVGMIEAQSEGMLCSILRFDEESGRLFHTAAPSLPEAYNKSVDGAEVGPEAGSCGTAVFRRERVIVEDMLTDPLWADYRDLALEHGLRASWSQPIFGAEDSVLGTFAMYYREPRRPSREDIELIEAAAHLAGVAIESRTSDEKLRASRTQLRQIIDLVPHMIFAKDGRDRFLLVNRAMAEAYNTDVGELLGKRQREVHLCEAEAERMHAQDREVIENRRDSFSADETFTDASGRARTLQTTRIPFRPTGSREPAVLGVAIDVTEQREMEQQLSYFSANLEQVFFEQPLVPDDTATWYRILYDSAPDFYVTLRPNGKVVEANRSLLTALGRKREEVVGRRVTRLVPPVYRPVLRRALSRLSEQATLQRDELELLAADGKLLPTKLELRAKRDSAGSVREIRMLLHDKGRRKIARHRLVQAEQLVTTGRLAAGVAHEINNPVQALLMHMAIVDDALPAEFAERASWETIRDGIQRIQQAMSDLLDLHRAGGAGFEGVDLNVLVEEAAALVSTKLEAERIELGLELQPDLPKARGMPRRLYQVILNLMLNGVEAMQDGGALAVRTRSDGGDLVLEVRDSGPGIPPEDLPRLFDPLYTGRKERGVGLGLFVTHSLVQEHGGTIEVESKLGAGTTLRVRLPADE
jgi:PAS domain S-box-containing protein